MTVGNHCVSPALLFTIVAGLALVACAGDDAVATTGASATTSASTSGGSETAAATTEAPTTTTTSGSASASSSITEATTSTTAMTTTTGETTSTTTTTTTTTTGESTGTTGVDACACVPDNERILVLTDDGEIWAYAPALNEFELLGDVVCPGVQKPYSMAVDRQGIAWIQYTSDGHVYTFDPKDPGPCAFAGVLLGGAGFDYVGMSFAPEAECDRLFLFNYSGNGLFKEAPGIGALGAFDPLTEATVKLGPTDYDGGELAGTGEGRLFAFTGVDPSKLVELDTEDAAVKSILPLPELRKTRASAFAFHSGDAYFFTEAVDLTCSACAEAECPQALAACQGDPVCDEALGCSIEIGEIQDECGGYMSPEILGCVTGPCAAACYTGTADIYSKVTRLDYDDSEGKGQVLTLVNPKAPDRIVGAAASTCAPWLPQ